MHSVTILLLVGLFFFGNPLFADGARPKNFILPNGVPVVFVDFQNAKYSVAFDVAKKRASYTALIAFETTVRGAPAFDLVEEPESLQLDGNDAGQVLIDSPDKTTRMRVLTKILSPGKYVLRVTGTITKNVEWTADSVKAAFWMIDMTDRTFLEQYLPTSFEYDQYLAQMEVTVLGTQKKHSIFTNGKPLGSRSQNFRRTIFFPDFYTTSSFFFHIGPESEYEILGAGYRSQSGRAVAIEIYKQKASSFDLDQYLAITLSTLKELEATFGPYPHTTLVIYAADGGMEHCGATISSVRSLSHEIMHSWFARGVMPANGNAGWLDEALVSWRDFGYKKVAHLRGSVPMANRGDYIRKGDSSGYFFGGHFIAHLFHLYPNFPEFLKSFYMKRVNQAITTEQFIQDMSLFIGQDVNPLFQKFIYTWGPESKRLVEKLPANPHDKPLSADQLRRLL